MKKASRGSIPGSAETANVVASADFGSESMSLSRQELFEIYNSNYKAIKPVFSENEQQAKRYLRRGQMDLYYAHSKVAFMIFSSLSEVSLFRLIYSHDNITDSCRRELLKVQRVIDKWRRLVDISFSNRYSIPRHSIPASLTPEQLYRYKKIHYYIDEYIEPLISTRNNLAHGEWEKCLNSKKNNVNSDRTSRLEQITIYRMNLQKKIVETLTASLFDLIATKNAFERDVDRVLGKLEMYERSLRMESEDDWNERLQLNHRRGKEKRN